MTLKYCPACGNELDPDTRFCSTCGLDLKERSPETISEPPKTIISPIQEKSSSKTQKTDSDSSVEYAEFFERFIALLIDGIILVIIGVFLGITLGWGLANFLIFGIGFLYFWLMETSNKGQTIGKMAMKLRTVKEDTLEVADVGEYLLNNLLKGHIATLIIDLIIGLIANSGDPQNKLRIMQKASGTAVIKVK